MAKIIIDSDNFKITSGNQGCNQCPLNTVFRQGCIRHFEFLFGSKCNNVTVEVKDGLDEIKLEE